MRVRVRVEAWVRVRVRVRVIAPPRSAGAAQHASGACSTPRRSSYLSAGWGAGPQPWEGLWRAGRWLRRGWDHCPGRHGGAPWPVAVT